MLELPALNSPTFLILLSGCLLEEQPDLSKMQVLISSREHLPSLVSSISANKQNSLLGSSRSNLRIILYFSDSLPHLIYWQILSVLPSKYIFNLSSFPSCCYCRLGPYLLAPTLLESFSHWFPCFRS